MLPILIDAFCKDAPKLLDQMRDAIARGDTKTLQRAAHTLKSNAANFGATALADVCQEIEHHAKRCEIERIAPLSETITTEYVKARAALEQLRPSSLLA